MGLLILRPRNGWDAPEYTLQSFITERLVAGAEQRRLQALRWRQQVVVPAVTPTWEEFTHAVRTCCANYLTFRYGNGSTISTKEISFSYAWDTIGDKAGLSYSDAERDSKYSYHGGFIGYMDRVAEGLAKANMDAYVDLQCFAYIPDISTPESTAQRARIIDELLAMCGVQFLFPEHYLLSPVVARAILMTSFGLHRRKDELHERIKLLVMPA